jgi:ubiquinone/menaquinone biosynthesis C-methylase UbiE
MTRADTTTADQDAITARYDRIAGFYDLMDKPMEVFGGRRRRKRVLTRAEGKTLEIGVGTGRNLGYYPDGVELTGIDVSAKMLAKARAAAATDGVDATLDLADVQDLPFDDASFDTVTATCVFCSVADPVAGLREVARVVRPEGQVLLLEHVRPRNRFLGWLADRIAPLLSRLIGPQINRRTEENIAAAGLDAVEVRRSGVWREIVARRRDADTGDR